MFDGEIKPLNEAAQQVAAVVRGLRQRVSDRVREIASRELPHLSGVAVGGSAVLAVVAPLLVPGPVALAAVGRDRPRRVCPSRDGPQ